MLGVVVWATSYREVLTIFFQVRPKLNRLNVSLTQIDIHSIG